MLQKDAIETGKVTVNGKQVADVNQPIRNGDIISHTLHRHEPPVSAQPIGIVHEDEDLIVINKPAGIPVHPAGRYNYNSVVELMRVDRGRHWNPMPCNRLDRLTSGIMFVAKHAAAAERLGKQIKQRSVTKEYVARVVGEFPTGDVVCEQPILAISPKLGLNRARASGKEARTAFRRLAYYPAQRLAGEGGFEHGETEDERRRRDEARPWRRKEGYSIVRCLPLTGRTHQLRVHLQFLGHPIANDPIYCNQRVFGPSLAAGDDTADADEDIISRLARMGKQEAAEAMAYHDEMMDDYNKRKAEKLTGQVCEVCDTPLYSDPGTHELGIYLHAKRYADADGGWSYETEMPAWALHPEGMEEPVEAADDTKLSTVVEKLQAVELRGVELAGPMGQEIPQAAVVAG